MKILHILSPVRFGGGESLLVTLLENRKTRLDEAVICWFSSQEFTKILKEKNIPVKTLSQKTLHDGPNKFIVAFWALCTLFQFFPLLNHIKAENPDIIHIHSFPANFVLAALKKLGFVKKRLILSKHCTATQYRGLAAFIFNWMYDQYDVICCVSETVKKSMPDRPKIKEKCVTIHNCVSDPFYHVQNAPQKTDERITFLQLARFSASKNHMLVVKSLASLDPAYRQGISVWFAGDGETRSTIEQFAKAHNLIEEGVVRFLGFIPHTKLPNLLSQVDYALFPSDLEGFGIGAAECMAAGKPVLCLNNALMQEVVGESGVLVEREKFATGFQTMIEKGPHLKEIARKKAQDYLVETANQKYLEMYSTVAMKVTK